MVNVVHSFSLLHTHTPSRPEAWPERGHPTFKLNLILHAVHYILKKLELFIFILFFVITQTPSRSGTRMDGWT